MARHIAYLVLSCCVVLSAAFNADKCDGYSSQSQCSSPPAVPLFPSHLPDSFSSLAVAFRATGFPASIGGRVRSGSGHPTPLQACGPHVSAASVSRRFAVIGDYGLEGNCAAQVSSLVKKIESQFGELDFVFNTGDNSYWSGACSSFQQNVGQYYSKYFTPGDTCTDPSDRTIGSIRDITNEARRQHLVLDLASNLVASVAASVDGNSTPKTPSSRFFPTLGNHDWDSYKAYADKLPYLQYFNFLSLLPPSDVGANGQYYTVRPIPEIQIYSLNSNLGSPSASEPEHRLFKQQSDWLQSSLASSNATFKFVFFHHPPFCTAQHDPLAPWMDLPYHEWGATAVFAGHEHVYERTLKNDIVYIVNGLGGHPWLYDIHNCIAQTGSRVRFNEFHGALVGLVSEAPDRHIDWCFYSVENEGTLVDHFLMPSK